MRRSAHHFAKQNIMAKLYRLRSNIVFYRLSTMAATIRVAVATYSAMLNFFTTSTRQAASFSHAPQRTSFPHFPVENIIVL